MTENLSEHVLSKTRLYLLTRGYRLKKTSLSAVKANSDECRIFDSLVFDDLFLKEAFANTTSKTVSLASIGTTIYNTLASFYSEEITEWYARSADIYTNRNLFDLFLDFQATKIISSLEREKLQLHKTPKDLVNEILNKIPACVWLNPNTRWLDPCCGTGEFIVQIFRRLIAYGHEPKHIIENMLFFNDINPNMVKLTEFRLDPENKYKRNAYNLDAIKKVDFYYEFTYTKSGRMKKPIIHQMTELEMEFSNMSQNPRDKNFTGFGVVVGNPPYQFGKNKIFYQQFIALGQNLTSKNGFLSLITPKAWLKNSVCHFRNLVNNFTVHHLNVDKCASYFPGISSSFSYFISEKTGNKNITTNVVLSTRSFNIDIKDFSDLATTTILEDETKSQILDKIYEDGSIKPIAGKGQNEFVFEKTDAHTYEVFLSTSNKNGLDSRCVYSSIEPLNYGITKLIIAHILMPGQSERYSEISTKGVGRYSFYFIMDTEEELYNLRDFFDTKVYHFIDFMKRHGRYAYLNIPNLDFTKKWTDTDLYNYFNFTQEEIDIIEQIV